MKRKTIVLLAALFALAAPLSAFAAMEHGDSTMEGMDRGKMQGMEQGAMKGMDHSGMAMSGNMMMLGDQVEGGVKASAHLKDVKEAMSKMGMKETHHFMVMFMDTATGKPIETGTVAVKIKDPSGNVSGPIKLMGMQGHFGADVNLNEPGKYEFMVGTKLKDGQKRQYHFEQMVE